MIYTRQLQSSAKRAVFVQFSTRAFAFGYTWEWGDTLFILIGPFSISVQTRRFH